MTTNNHQAHAPLTSRRLHQMRDIFSKAASQRDGGDIGYAMADAVKLIDEVLAGRDAVPDEIDKWQAIDDMRDHDESLRWDSATGYENGWNACRAAMLKAGNSPVVTDCSCRACRPVTITDMRFVVCPDCGNKRCPHANDHRNACSGSNEPGQEGSAYPAAPQQEVDRG